MIQQTLIGFLLVLGGFFVLVAALGILRMPDLYCRMHAATKAGALGTSLLLLALVCAAPTLRVVVQSLMIVLFFFLTAPVAAQMIGRAALHAGVPLWRSEDARKSGAPDTPPANDPPDGKRGADGG